MWRLRDIQYIYRFRIDPLKDKGSGAREDKMVLAGGGNADIESSAWGVDENVSAFEFVFFCIGHGTCDASRSAGAGGADATFIDGHLQGSGVYGADEFDVCAVRKGFMVGEDVSDALYFAFGLLVGDEDGMGVSDVDLETGVFLVVPLNVDEFSGQDALQGHADLSGFARYCGADGVL